MSTIDKKQTDFLVKLTMINFRNPTTVPAHVLFINATGGGEPLIRDIHFVMFCGVSLTIVYMIALGADQTLKVNTKFI